MACPSDNDIPAATSFGETRICAVLRHVRFVCVFLWFKLSFRIFRSPIVGVFVVPSPLCSSRNSQPCSLASVAGMPPLAVFTCDGSCADFVGFTSAACRLQLPAGRPAETSHYAALHPGGAGPQTAELVAILLALELVDRSGLRNGYVEVRTDSESAIDYAFGTGPANLSARSRRFSQLATLVVREIEELERHRGLRVHLFWWARSLNRVADRLSAEMFAELQHYRWNEHDMPEDLVSFLVDLALPDVVERAIDAAVIRQVFPIRENPFGVPTSMPAPTQPLPAATAGGAADAHPQQGHQVFALCDSKSDSGKSASDSDTVDSEGAFWV